MCPSRVCVCVCAGVLACRDFSTEVDIALRKWAEDEGRLAQLCTSAAQESVLEVLRSKIEVRGGAQGRGGANQGGTMPHSASPETLVQVYAF